MARGWNQEELLEIDPLKEGPAQELCQKFNFAGYPDNMDKKKYDINYCSASPVLCVYPR